MPRGVTSWEPSADLAQRLVAAGRDWWSLLKPYEQVFWEVLVANDGPVSAAVLVEQMRRVDPRVKEPLTHWVNKFFNGDKANFTPLYNQAFGQVDQGHYWHSATSACKHCLPLNPGEYAAAAGMRWLVTRILGRAART